tara:strand:+ start:567 stop:1064 length:498 start_codon:yes stop_codon:yes gene_type:complete
MWAIIKFDKKKYNLLKKELKSNFGDDCTIYRPLLLIEKFTKNKLVKKEISLLNDYLFCFHKSFEKKNALNKLKYFVGLKYFLNGFHYSQSEIENFVKNLKKIENDEGYITRSIFEVEINKFYKFNTGSFANKIFKVLSLQKNKLNIMMGNLKSTINKNEFIFSPL